MSSFDRLHPALRHHIVNSLGWRELRPFQDAVIPRVLSGEHLVVLAPTAGGKTEAAAFPIISRILTEDWSPLSVIYLCPIKALLNNLDMRLGHYFSLVGRRSGLWHGDVSNSARKRLLAEPPDCLLTTPESLEVMLMSRRVDQAYLFANLRAIVVDEIHAFAGDDRGWHLLSVLQRVSKLAGREIQRIGLSATVGNPDTLVEWLAGGCEGKRGVYLPAIAERADVPEVSTDQPPSIGASLAVSSSAAHDADVRLDFVGSLENASTVISRLHRGEKRLVFVDSRARAEELGTSLRCLGIDAYVTHSALSQEERHRTESAFAARQNCVIVATSVLELGIDVGDLDRVIQIDCPPSVASFLQRMGRTGRRRSTTRNCLVLATRPNRLVQAAALIRLWREGYVEPVKPPPEPYHILAQQLMAIAIQEGGVAGDCWYDWLRGVHGFDALPPERVEGVVSWMIANEMLFMDGALISMGTSGERIYGHKNFMDLFSVFTSPPLFNVLHGRLEIGQIEESCFMGKQEGKRIVSLGGRFWQVNHIDWQRRRVFVEPTEEIGRSSWFGGGWGLEYAICKAMRQLLTAQGDNGAADPAWSRRATDQIGKTRADFGWLSASECDLVEAPGEPMQWWTFAGAKANATLAQHLAANLNEPVLHDGFAIRMPAGAHADDIIEAIRCLRLTDITELAPVADERAIGGLKFSDCLPPDLARNVMSMRLRDDAAVLATLSQPLRRIHRDDVSTTKGLLGGTRPKVAYAPGQSPRPKSNGRNSAKQAITPESGDGGSANPAAATLALSLRQPWAELVMRGDKDIEYRSQPTRIRGRIFIYAASGRQSAAEEIALGQELGIDLDALPRGVLVGTVEITDCRPSDQGDYEWELRDPQRFETPVSPKNRANPVWFRPFDP